MEHPAGWYDDPWDPRRYRYWDGTTWTGHSSPKFLADVQGSPAAGQPFPPAGPRTADGVPLSGWWRRVGARLLDGLIINVLSLPLTLYFYIQLFDLYRDFYNELLAQARSGQERLTATPPPEVIQYALTIALLSTLVSLGYEAILLRRNGATLGKRAAGIRVRPTSGEGKLAWSTIAKRVGLYFGLGLASAIPFVGFLVSLASLLNVLWPLWDDKRQALHDKLAGTQVVRA